VLGGQFPYLSPANRDNTRYNPVHTASIKKPPAGKEKVPWRLHTGTFCECLFILYSRRPKARLLVKQEKMGIGDP
jgi:hypothetical protein